MKHTTRTILFFIALFAAVAAHAQVQPQFKFYLAFEDAKQERDTVWIILDQDSHELFYEDEVPYDSSKFQVCFGGVSPELENDSIQKVFSYYIGLGGSRSYYVFGLNHQLPITMRWDTNLLKNHDLPFELRQAWVYGNGIWKMGYPFGFDLFFGPYESVDSLVLESFTIGGGQGDHFPLQLTLSKNERIIGEPDGFQKIEHKMFSLVPNPANSVVKILVSIHLHNSDLSIINSSGQVVGQLNINTDETEMDVSTLPPGIYSIIIQNSNSTYYEKLCIEP